MTVNDAPMLPEVEVTWTGTFTDPVIDGWMLQWYGYEPAKSIAWRSRCRL